MSERKIIRPEVPEGYSKDPYIVELQRLNEEGAFTHNTPYIRSDRAIFIGLATASRGRKRQANVREKIRMGELRELVDKVIEGKIVPNSSEIQDIAAQSAPEGNPELMNMGGQYAMLAAKCEVPQTLKLREIPKDAPFEEVFPVIISRKKAHLRTSVIYDAQDDVPGAKRLQIKKHRHGMGGTRESQLVVANAVINFLEKEVGYFRDARTSIEWWARGVIGHPERKATRDYILPSQDMLLALEKVLKMSVEEAVAMRRGVEVTLDRMHKAGGMQQYYDKKYYIGTGLKDRFEKAKRKTGNPEICKRLRQHFEENGLNGKKVAEAYNADHPSSERITPQGVTYLVADMRHDPESYGLTYRELEPYFGLAAKQKVEFDRLLADFVESGRGEGQKER